MDRQSLRNVVRGTIATMPTPFDDKFEVDIPRLRDLTQWWVEQGLGVEAAPLKVAAAMGEGAFIEDTEWPHMLRTVVNAAGPDKNVICALKPKDTLHTIRDARIAQDLGAVALQIDLPFYFNKKQDDYVRFFSDISDAVDIGIMIYNTFWYGCEPISADTMLRLRDAERVVAVKWSVPKGGDYDEMTKFVDHFNVIDNASQPARCHRNGGHGYISSTICAYPRHDLEIWDLLEAKRYDEAQAQFDRVFSAVSEWTARAASRAGVIRAVKGKCEAMGVLVGPPRPPGLPVDEQELAEIKSILKGVGWPAIA